MKKKKKNRDPCLQKVEKSEEVEEKKTRCITHRVDCATRILRSLDVPLPYSFYIRASPGRTRAFRNVTTAPSRKYFLPTSQDLEIYPRRIPCFLCFLLHPTSYGEAKKMSDVAQSTYVFWFVLFALECLQVFFFFCSFQGYREPRKVIIWSDVTRALDVTKNFFQVFHCSGGVIEASLCIFHIIFVFTRDGCIT